jgi:TPR repeat protein
MQWFRLGRDQAQEAALEARVTALQTALARCKGVAARWSRLRRGLIAATAVVFLGLGFALGVYREAIKQSVVDLGKAVGIVRPVMSADAAEAAYQKGNYEAALRLARPLAEQNNAAAEAILGRLYARGRGVPLDEAEAGKWFRRAAEHGSAAAQFNLGNLYAEGKGVPQDYSEAVKWYRLAAERGDPQAQYNLGLAYAKGEGVAEDSVSAHMWLNLAAARFPASDAANRGVATASREAVANRMSPEEIADAQKRAREFTPK